MQVYKHIIGSCVVRDDNAFLLIPKNASTTYMDLGHIDNTSNHSIAWKNFIVTLRDPYTRWLAGVSEYYIRHESAYDRIEDLERVLDKIELDEHTVPQIKFFKHLLENSHTEFYLLEHGLEKVNDKYDLWSNIPVVYKSDPFKKAIQYGVRQYVTANPKLGEKIKLFYKEDYNFINEQFPDYTFKEVI